MRTLAGGSVAVLLAVLFGWATGAGAAVQQDLGFNVTPAQPYLHNPNASDWIGSYVVGGRQAWPAIFAFDAPDGAGTFTSGGSMLTKWGTPIDPTIAAEANALLFLNGSTTSPDNAAATAQLIYQSTSSPQNPSQLDPSNDFLHIAYDVNYHLSKLPSSTETAVTQLTTEAAADQGPWTLTITAPGSAQIIGTAGNWSLEVKSATGNIVPNVPLTLTATGGTLPNGSATQSFVTPANSSPLLVPVTPTAADPQISAAGQGPAASPNVLTPTSPDVTTVWEPISAPITGQARTTAAPATAGPPTTTTTSPPTTTTTTAAALASSTPTTQPPVAQPLAVTGSDVWPQMAAGLIAIGAGTLAVRIGARRRVAAHRRRHR